MHRVPKYTFPSRLAFELGILFLLLLEVGTRSVVVPTQRRHISKVLSNRFQDLLTGVLTGRRNYTMFSFLVHYFLLEVLATCGKSSRVSLPTLIYVDLTSVDYEHVLSRDPNSKRSVSKAPALSFLLLGLVSAVLRWSQ